MFLDPDPKLGGKQGTQSRMSAPSGFFSSQRPIVSPRDHRTTIRRKPQPLAERSQSQNNQQNPWSDDPDNSTVRLVKPSPLRFADRTSDTDYDDDDDEISAIEQNIQGQQVLPEQADVKPASASNAGLPGFPTSSLAKNVSGSDTSANEAQEIGWSDTSSLLSTTPTHAHFAIHAAPRREWHRRSGSTGNYSTSSTLKGAEDSGIFIPSIGKGDTRSSQGTTVRGTPTPTEQEVRQRIEAEDLPRQTSVHTLETLQETSPERSTLRAVEVSSEESGSISDPSESASSPNFRIFPSPSEVDPRTSSWEDFTNSSPTRARSSSDTRFPRNESSQETILHTEAILPPSSSPNYVAYSPDSTRPRSGTYPLHHTYSTESIDSRLQYPTLVRPETGRSIASTTSWSSLRPPSSRDYVAPLYVPKKRLRHKAGSSSLNAAANSSFTSGYSMADEDYDTLPYPREQFSSHLSTIASESDRTGSQQLSHFSLGSGVLTGDDASSIPLSGTWPRRRRESAPVSSIASDLPRELSSEEDAGDMTLGVFRDESAKPQPLFEPRAGAIPGERRYSGPLPPLPPMPTSPDNDEHTDRVPELQAPQLREKRSGYSLRGRSNSTPSRGHSRHLSRSESDRWSQGSFLFPTWARNFYGNGAALMSASKISLGPPSTPQRGNGNGQSHQRSNSHWTERSITSRLGTGYSEVDPPSPTSSHFLPSIFRPRTRKDGSSKHRKSKRSRPSGDSASRPDSLQIFNDPIHMQQTGEASTILPSGHPKFGSLKDGSEQHRPLPRKYSKQKQWNDMQFPRPMTKDRLSDFHMDMESQDPRLAPTKRSSYRLSAWRAPSFVESLDTLLKSRCNRQILLFALGFVCPLLWMVGAVLPIPKKPISAEGLHDVSVAGSEDDIQTAMMKHEAGDAERRWREEKAWLKGRWWRWLNRIMSLVGVGVVAAVVSALPLVVVKLVIAG